ncbi:aldehyde dehydrogenase family protein [Streptomyces aureus]|uniref:aldehyde dehydrogenase family protein n=2 Tax=Streptomyces TaxID=1883 RepID=UPI003620D32D
MYPCSPPSSEARGRASRNGDQHMFASTRSWAWAMSCSSRAGGPLAEHTQIQLVHFTGSVEAGRKIGAGTGERLHRAVLELGGKDPVVVDAGVDPPGGSGSRRVRRLHQHRSDLYVHGAHLRRRPPPPVFR